MEDESGTARGGDVGGHLCEGGGALLRFDGLHAAARLFEVDDGLLEGNQRRDFGVLPGFVGELLLLAQQPRAEQEVVDLAGLAEGVEVDFSRKLQLIGVEFLEFRVPVAEPGRA